MGRFCCSSSSVLLGAESPPLSSLVSSFSDSSWSAARAGASSAFCSGNFCSHSSAPSSSSVAPPAFSSLTRSISAASGCRALPLSSSWSSICGCELYQQLRFLNFSCGSGETRRTARRRGAPRCHTTDVHLEGMGKREESKVQLSERRANSSHQKLIHCVAASEDVLPCDIGLSVPISTIRIASLATTTALLANEVFGNAAAAVEASTAVSDENSNFMFVVICIGEAIALTGAAVGGILARQRKIELEKINAQLRQINVNLRRQSRVETYAPNLTYAPVGSGRMADLQVRSDPVRDRLMLTLKTGKRYLREQNPASAYQEFQKAIVLAQKLKDTAEEKKATRGLGASCQRQGKYKEAINHHLLVLDISKRTGENSGDTEAYGAIADCYTEHGDLETAGKYYDKYIERLETDDTL